MFSSNDTSEQDVGNDGEVSGLFDCLLVRAILDMVMP